MSRFKISALVLFALSLFAAPSRTQAQTSQIPLQCKDTSGSPTAQSCTTVLTMGPVSGDSIIYTTTTGNTGDVTLNVDSKGAAHIRKWSGSSVLASGDLVANVPVQLIFDGTYWELQTIGNVPSGGSGTVTHTVGALGLGLRVIGNAGADIQTAGGVLNCAAYTGATLDVIWNACNTAAIAAGNWAMDMSAFSGAQTYAAQMACGDVSGDAITCLLPATFTWTSSGFTGGTSCGIIQYPQTYLHGVSPNLRGQLKNGSATNGMLAQYCTSGASGYYKADNFTIYNPSVSNASGTSFYVKQAADNSFFNNIDVVDYADNVAGAEFINNCCSVAVTNMTVNGNYTLAAPPLLVLSNSGGTNNGLEFRGGSFDHPAATYPNFQCTDTSAQHNSHIVFSGQTYEEGPNSGTSSIFNVIAGCGSVSIDDLELKAEIASSTGAAFSITNTTNTAFSIGKLTEILNFTLPGTAIVNNYTGNTYATDSNGNYGNYNSAPSAFENLTAYNFTLGGLFGGPFCLTETNGAVTNTGSTCSAGAGANTALSNLAAVAVNLALAPGTDNSISLDSLTKRYVNGWFGGVVGWTNGSGTADTGLSRDSAGVVDVGNGTAGDKSGTLQATVLETVPDGVHPSVMSFVGNTTLPTPASNTGNIIGPPSATPTAYTIQIPSSVPATGSLLACVTTSTNCLLAPATGAQISAGIQTLTGCNTAGNVFTPQASDCIAQNITSVTNSDSSLTISPTTGLVVASINLAHVNLFTVNQSALSFTATGATAGFADFPQGTTSAAVAPCNVANSWCVQAATAMTAGIETLDGTRGQGVQAAVGSSAALQDVNSGDANHSTTVTTSSATSVSSTSLCSTTNCPAGTYQVTAYLDVTTACSTTGTYSVSIIYTDDAASKTIVMPLQGTGATTTYGPTAITSSLALAATTNFAQGVLVVHSTGAASINYSTTATACGTGGPAAGKLYLSVFPIQ